LSDTALGELHGERRQPLAMQIAKG